MVEKSMPEQGSAPVEKKPVETVVATTPSVSIPEDAAPSQPTNEVGRIEQASTPPADLPNQLLSEQPDTVAAADQMTGEVQEAQQ